MNLKSINR